MQNKSIVTSALYYAVISEQNDPSKCHDYIWTFVLGNDKISTHVTFYLRSCFSQYVAMLHWSILMTSGWSPDFSCSATIKSKFCDQIGPPS